MLPCLDFILRYRVLRRCELHMSNPCPRTRAIALLFVTVAWLEFEQNSSRVWPEVFKCKKCAPGCLHCKDPSPCLATYHWPFRITLLTFSIICAMFVFLLICYVYQHRKLKVFKVASPIFLSITLLGCAIMYLEVSNGLVYPSSVTNYSCFRQMVAIFPVLDTYACIATKWSRHLGFCITYTALLMKTWR